MLFFGQHHKSVCNSLPLFPTVFTNSNCQGCSLKRCHKLCPLSCLQVPSCSTRLPRGCHTQEIREVRPARCPGLQARQELGHHTLLCRLHKTPELTSGASNQMHQQTMIKALSDHLFDQKNHKKPIRPLLARTWSKEQRSSLRGVFNQKNLPFLLSSELKVNSGMSPPG